MSPQPFERDDVVQLTERCRRGEEKFEVRIKWIERRDGFWYFGWEPMDTRQCGWGCSRIMDNPREYGTVAWKRVGRMVPTDPPSPGSFEMLRNPGFDLMHDPKPDLP